jgi:hypothetical protein
MLGNSWRDRWMVPLPMIQPPKRSQPRRMKRYAAETGIEYFYFAAGQRQVIRPEGQGPGTDIVLVVSTVRRAPTVFRVFVADRASRAWRETTGRELDSGESHAAAKFRMFQALDALPDPFRDRCNLVVDENNIRELLASMDLE